MAAVLFHEPIFATLVESGDKLYFYEVGTTDDLTVYSDFALSSEHAQPVVADSDGNFPAIYLDSTGEDPKVVLTDADDVEKWTLDRYPIEDTSAMAADLEDVEDDVDSIDGRLTDVETDIETLQSESADYEDRISDLEGGGSAPGVEIFTGSGTYTKPEGLKLIKVTVVGGGGGGVQVSAATCGGAGGGAAIKWIAAANVGATETVTIGAGGAGKTASPGNDGGTSSFGSHCSATGGKGGKNQTEASTEGGIGQNGDLNVQGGSGNKDVAGDQSSGNYIGGGTYLGFGSTSSDVLTPGAGGRSVVGGAGKDGADGIVIVEEFF